MPSDISLVNSKVASSTPNYIMDPDIHDHCDNNDYNHYSAFEEKDYCGHDYSDFCDDMILTQHICPPGRHSFQPLFKSQAIYRFFFLFLLPPVELDNPEPDKKMDKISMPDTIYCLDTAGTIHNKPTVENLDTECHLMLPDYADFVLPPLVDTVFSLQNTRFKYPLKSAPTPEMHTDNRSDEQILADIVRTCSLNVTKG